MQDSGVHDKLMAQQLLDWYVKVHRTLPWRDTTDPYHIWVSEVMLQQTQVVTVIPYYQRFLKHFPTVTALAGATLDEVLAQWRGLGYYSRARSLHRAAQEICLRFQGQIPHTLSDLLSLPGIGDYSAGAILSIAFGQDTVAVDGNVRRVFCRLHNYAGLPSDPRGRKAIRDYAQAMLPGGLAGTFNQALMELGATLCSVKNPRCEDCPLCAECEARMLGLQDQRPVTLPRPPLPRRFLVSTLVACEQRILLVRRLPKGLLGGLWELPGGELQPGEDHATALHRLLAANLGVQVMVGEQCAAQQQAYTHFLSFVTVYRSAIAGTLMPQHNWDTASWLAPAELAGFGLTGVTVKVLRSLGYIIDHAK
jgi:A/G-specific adenine glycosylase